MRRRSDQPGKEEIVARCVGYWRETGVDDATVDLLRSTLVDHLAAAADAGKDPRSAVGRDPIRHAEAMAAPYRVPPPPYPIPAPSTRARRRWVDLIPAYGWITPALALTVLLVILGPKEDAVEDPELWRWLWVGIAVVLGIGEMVTAGFFMLPFAIGAALAAMLAWADVAIAAQLIVFIVTSLLALVGLRRFAWSDREPSYSVGAKRFVNAKAVVIETIDPVTGRGRVRLDTEQWGAVTDGDAVIGVGRRVRVVDVRGARLVVEPAPTTAEPET